MNHVLIAIPGDAEAPRRRPERHFEVAEGMLIVSRSVDLYTSGPEDGEQGSNVLADRFMNPDDSNPQCVGERRKVRQRLRLVEETAARTSEAAKQGNTPS